MNKLTLKKLDGKSDEIEFLEELAAAIPEDSYLAKLFSRDLICWVTQQIEWDFFPDIMSAWNHEIACRNLAEEKKLAIEKDLLNRVTGLERQVGQAIDDYWRVYKQKERLRKSLHKTRRYWKNRANKFLARLIG